MNDNSIQNEDKSGEQQPTDDNKALQTGGGDPIDRKQNNNGLGELDPSTEAAEPTMGSAKTASASIPAASVTALKKAQGVLVSISLGTPCEKVTHEDECCEDPPIVSDTYHAPETPVKTKGGKSTVTHPSEHPKPVNKGAQKRPGANGGIAPSGKTTAPAEEKQAEMDKKKKADEKAFDEKKAQDRAFFGPPLHDSQIVDRLQRTYKMGPYTETKKSEEGHIPTWDEIRKSIANKETAQYLQRLKEYPNDASQLNMSLLSNAANSQRKEMSRIQNQTRKDFGGAYSKGEKEVDKMICALSKLGLAPEMVSKLVGTAYPDMQFGGREYTPPTPYPDPIMRAVSDNVKENEGFRGGKRDNKLNSSRSAGRADALYNYKLDSSGSDIDFDSDYDDDDESNTTPFHRGENHIPTWDEIRKAQTCIDTKNKEIIPGSEGTSWGETNAWENKPKELVPGIISRHAPQTEDQKIAGENFKHKQDYSEIARKLMRPEGVNSTLDNFTQE